MNHIIKLVLLLLCVAMCACKSDMVREDSTMRLSFSTDTLCFDTIFTEAGSTTARVMIYNKNAYAMRIRTIDMPYNSCFHLNVDGETDPDNWHDIELRGGDSMFLFVQVKINPQKRDDPVFIEEKVAFVSNANTDTLVLQAYGQDVIRLARKGRSDVAAYHFTAKRPYLILDTLVIYDEATIEAGTTIYMHKGALLYCMGNMTAEGTLEQPIRILGDRRDQLFAKVPYAYAAGQWDGVYLVQSSGNTNRTGSRTNNTGSSGCQWNLNHVDITSGNIGLYCWGDSTTNLPHLHLQNSRIHNMAAYGLVLRNVNAEVENSEISNAAGYCAYLSGGKHRFTHTTVASYFNATNVRIQSTAREDVAAVYINNLSKQQAKDSTSFVNSIIAGARKNQLVVATPFDRYYPGRFEGCYLQTDTLQLPGAVNNVYGTNKDTMFVNTYYEYEVYEYYDFHLDSLSPARGIGLAAYALPYDREGVPRTDSIQAGCYQ